MAVPDDHEHEPAYRWVIVVASAVMLGLGVGFMVNGLSVFFVSLKGEFGWLRGSVSLIYTAGVLGMALGGIVMGRLADRSTARRVSLMGVVVLALCLLGAARADALWQFYVLFFLAGFMGAGALFTPLVANVGNWFKTNVGLALGIASAGQALGTGIVPFGTAVLIGAMGWRDALNTMGLIALVALLPLAFLIRQPPKAPAAATGVVLDDESPVPLAPNVVIIWLSIAVVFCCICMSVPLMHLVPLAQDKGIPLEGAASIMLVMLISAVVGRVAFGKLADMIGAIRAYWIASCWQAVLVFGFTQIDSLNALYIFAVIYGFGYAGVMTGIIICVRVLTPLSKRATALGVTTLFGWIGHAIGGYQGGLFFDLTGNYAASYANAALAGAINLIIVAALYVTISRRTSALAEVAA